MCGVVGFKPLEKPWIGMPDAFGRLFFESRIRGHHAYGLATPMKVLRSYRWEEIPANFNPEVPVIAHTRYCQSGDWHDMKNNQPLVVGNMKLAMNGVIHMGTKEEFEKAFDVRCEVDNDSEIFLQRLAKGQDANEFIQSITGSFSATWLIDDQLWAGRNARRPLWKCVAFGGLWYASTRDIFLRAKFPEPTEVSVGVENVTSLCPPTA